MRKLLMLVVTATTIGLTSCSNDQEINAPDGGAGERVIGFRTLMDKGDGTRAAITTKESLLSFTVTGVKMTTGATPAADGLLFNAFGITRGEDSSWDYTPKRYWPADRTVDFYAYSPSSSKNVSSGLMDFEAGTSKISYTVPLIGKEEGQEDFLVAKTLGHTEDKGVVMLNFDHALSRVMFLAKTSNANVTYIIEGVRLLQLSQTADLDLASEYATQAQPWENHSATLVDYVADMGKSPTYLLNEYKSILGETGAILVMPQQTKLWDTETNQTPISGEFAIEVLYKAFIGDTYYAGSADAPATRYFAVRNPLDDTQGITFEMGRQYNFYLGFGDDVGGEIGFGVNVSGWTETPNIYIPEMDNYAELVSEDLALIANQNFASDKKVTNDQIMKIEQIAVSNVSLTDFDFKGLEYFKKLTSISLNNVKAAGESTDLNASKNVLLTSVSIANSQLENVNLKNGVLTSLAFSGTNTITALDASNNKLTSVTFAQGTVIDGDLNLSNNTALKGKITLDGVTINGTLNLSNTGITEVEIKGESTLGDVILSDAALTKLTLTDANTINSLNAANNAITTISIATGSKINNGLNLSGNATLATITFDGVEIAGTLNLKKTGATTVTIKGSTLGTVDLTENGKLETLAFEGTNVFTSLDASNNKLTGVTFDNENGTTITGELNLSGNASLKKLDFTGVTLTTDLDLSKTSIEEVTFAGSILGTVNLKNGSLTTLAFSGTSTNITSLDASNNKLTSVVFDNENGTTITGSLNLSGNVLLTTINLTKVTVIGTLNLSGCAIATATIDDTKIGNDVTPNPIVSFTGGLCLASNKFSGELILKDSKFSTLDVSKNTGLTKLTFSNTGTSSAAGDYCTIGKVDATGNTALEEVEIGSSAQNSNYTRISEFDIRDSKEGFMKKASSFAYKYAIVTKLRVWDTTWDEVKSIISTHSGVHLTPSPFIEVYRLDDITPLGKREDTNSPKPYPYQ